MSQDNLEVVRAIYAAWELGDYPAALDRFHEDIEWFGPPDVTSGGAARGHEGVNRYELGG